MKLPVPRPQYDVTTERLRNLALEQADAGNRKNNADVVVGKNQRLLIFSPNGTRYSITVSNTGVITATPA